MLTCAHVVRDHLGLADLLPNAQPAAPITIRFEALQAEVVGRVLAGGWFTKTDIAVIRLEQSVAISPVPAIAPRMPSQSRPVLTHGAEADYQSYGQQVQGEISGSNIARGWRQIDPKDSVRGFTVERGFSGSPVLDDLGNVVWGMIVGVDRKGRGVAFAVPADNLWTALRSAGVETEIRAPDANDERDEAAMAALRAQYEAQLADRNVEAERMRQELDQLRQSVKGLGQEARESPNPQAATTALDALAGGDVAPAAEVLRRRMEERLAAADEARHDAAAAARQLGTMLKLVDAKGALEAFRRAAECQAKDSWTWIEIARLERRTGTLDAAMVAIETALDVAGEVNWPRGVALEVLGDIRFQLGDLSGALAAYEEGLKFYERHSESDTTAPTFQLSLSIHHDRIGNIRLAQGNLLGALGAYQQGLAIREQFAAQDPADTDWQRGLSISHSKIGDVRRAQGDLIAALAAYEQDLTIARRLAVLDAGNTEWQRDLSISYNRIGSVRRAQGDLSGALAAYEQDLAIAERLVALDARNTVWQRDLLSTQIRIAEIREAQGDLSAALALYEKSLAIIEPLAARDPTNAVWREDLAYTKKRVAEARRQIGNKPVT